MSTRVVLLAMLFISGSLWLCSEWWEKGLATPLSDPFISPNGCYRLQSFKPFWVLPDILHRKADPNEDISPEWLPWWGYPGFFRLYDHRSGQLLGESKIHDLEQASGSINWGVSGHVYAGMIYISPNAADCVFDKPTPTED